MIHDIARDKLLFADIETVGVTRSLADLDKLNKPLADVFREYFDNGTLCRRYPDKECDTAEKMFPQVAALMTEFSKMVSIAFGVQINDKWYKSVHTGHDEKALLIEADKAIEKNYHQGRYLCIYNGKHFDVPFLVRKMIEHGMPGNPMLPTYNQKPWDYRLVDPKDAWQLGTRSALAKLTLVCAFLGVQSPKDGEVTGATMHDYYWEGVEIGGEEDTRRLGLIGEYCQDDVRALRDITSKMLLQE